MSRVRRSTAMQARVRGRAGPAALAVALTSLAVFGLASPALASVAAAALTNVPISGSESTTAGVTTFSYVVGNSVDSGTNPLVDAFEIPELAAGDLDIASFTGPEGWSATLEVAPTQSGTSLKGGMLAGAYILVSTVPGTIGVQNGAPQSFTFTTSEIGTVAANFGVTVDGYAFGNGYSPIETGYVDPPVPGGAGTDVPEPATLAILGGAVIAVGVIRRRTR